MSNVKLAIRVRPFTERELKSEQDRIPVISVEDEHTVTLTNIKVSLSGAGDSRERVRRYYADYTLNSACSHNLPAYASQDKVFDTIGREVLAAVNKGSSACVLTYGQSATGKTHTMIGSETQPGLVPRLCRALTERQPCDVTISFLEIYNERVHDLLVGEAPLSACHSLPRRRGNSRKDLRVREHPTRGPYVQNLRRVAVHDAEALLSLVEEGCRRRRTAATRRNSTSSRSHALLALSTPYATLHLADLAGRRSCSLFYSCYVDSEKASWEGCGGGRQKEGANINKSLVALSNVISALVSGGGSRGKYVPYRDSSLTWLLKDCFTGAGCTFIITTISPSAACYGESASTLRWAARARQLPTARLTANIGSNQTRAALQAQLNQLLTELTKHYIRYVPTTGEILFDKNHWKFAEAHKNHNVVEAEKERIKINNIMNNSSSKRGDQNTEPVTSSGASVSSDVELPKQSLTEEITKEVDKVFGPALERTVSGTDLKMIAPVRHKRRQYRSQEVLPIDKSLYENLDSNLFTQSQIQITDSNQTSKNPSVSILHENQRAEIVASVTERLYSKLKKKEEAAVSKVETLVDKKVMEPLSELRICSNARQRLVELSRKALKNKRRIGIPAHTQTRARVTRVRDQGTDIQKDLDSYLFNKSNPCVFHRDIGTETIPSTPRCKEIGVGPNHGSLLFSDRATMTEPKRVIYRNTFMMTDNVSLLNRYTQTHIMPPPRRKKRLLSTSFNKKESTQISSQKCSLVPVVSINISQSYPVESESQTSDDNLEDVVENRPCATVITPDLLTNHSNPDTNLDTNYLQSPHKIFNNQEQPQASQNSSDEFPDIEDDLLLPRVSGNSATKSNHGNIKEIILGHDKDIYPYNIILSPPKQKENIKRIVQFKDLDSPSSANYNARSANDEVYFSSDITNSDKELPGYEDIGSDSTVSSKDEKNSFVWKKGGVGEYSKTMSYCSKKYTPVYKNNPRFRTAKAKIYKEFLGLEVERANGNLLFKRYINDNTKNPMHTHDYESKDDEEGEEEDPQHGFREKWKFFEDKYKDRCKHAESTFKLMEKNILDNCSILEMSVNKYDNYLKRREQMGERNNCKSETSMRSPAEYKQHLMQLRKEAIRAGNDSTNDSQIHINYY